MLTEESFELAAYAISTAEGLRGFLAGSVEVGAVRRALAEGSISTEDISEFVSELLKDFRPGRRFFGDVQIAAICVAIETLPGSFAEGFLSDLSTVDASETPLAPRVARIARAKRGQLLPEQTDRLMQISTEIRSRSQAPFESRPFRFEADMEFVSLGFPS
jgi:hypothetical protein